MLLSRADISVTFLMRDILAGNWNENIYAEKQKEHDMKSNGYGSWIASIVLTVDGPHAAQAAESLKTTPHHVAAKTGVAKFKVEMRVSRRGDDETLLFELGHQLHLDPSCWSIDWENSYYS